MIRSKDLDTIAPDDPILETNIPDSVDQIGKEIPKSKKNNCSYKKIIENLGHTKSSFSSFLVNPDVFDFPERKEDESIILAVRPHWFINFKWILITITMVMVPTILNFLDVLQSLPFRYQFVSTLFWYLITFIYAFEKFLDWYFDVFIVTTERLVDIKFNNLLNKHFAEADLEMVQDVSSSVRGVFGTFFNYGTILVQTASGINQIIFKNVPNPPKIIRAIQELIDDREGKHPKGGSNK
ncbi:MAG: PH domain-containing protein [Candidatus Shapirobacteria bacterium]|nr:PH domain-containing protein [Candidatus Shapirobacteria bacterium]